MKIRFISYLSTLFLALLLLGGCNIPNEQLIVGDFKVWFSKEVGNEVDPIIISIVSGEGDSQNVYEYIKFDVIAVEDIIISKGLLKGTSLQKGEKLCGGELVMLYQDTGRSEWVVKWFKIHKLPK